MAQDDRATSHFRRSRRQPVEMRIRYRRNEPGSTLEHAATTSDLGLGGAFIRTDRPLPIGTPVLLLLDSPTSWDPLQLEAEVRWVSEGNGSDPPGFGIRFDHLSGTQATALYELIEASGYAEPEE